MPRSNLKKKNNSLVILGAGSTGLSTGYILRDNPELSIQIIEKSHKPGGLAGSFKWDNHVIDYGPHRLSPNLTDVVDLVKNLLGSQLKEGLSDHGVQLDSTLYQFPVKVSQWISISGILWVSKVISSLLYCKIKYMCSRKDTFPIIMKNRFGRFFYKSVLEGMTKKVWIHPEKIDPKFADERFSLIKPTEILKSVIQKTSSRNPNAFFYPRLGYQQIWDEMLKSCIKSEVSTKLNHEVVECQVKNDEIISVTIKHELTQKVEQIHTKNSRVLSTIPISILCRCIKGGDVTLARTLDFYKDIKIRSMILVSLEFKQSQTLPHRTLIFPDDDIVFNRLFEQNLYSNDTVENGKSIVVADITCDPTDMIYTKNKEEVAQIVINDLSSFDYIDLEKLERCFVIHVPFAYMVPDVVSREKLEQVLMSLKKIKNLDLMGRFSIGEYDNSDYAIKNAINYSKFISSNQIDASPFEIVKNREIVG